jgi:hypothetical protein
MNSNPPEEHIHSDHQPHPAHAESHVIEKSLWRRIMDWRGSFFILSLLAHIVIIGIAAFLVVQVVQGRKEKLKFTAPPPAPPSESVHVKPAKKTPVASPSMTKRITSTALNASIALPPMEINTASPDIMSSVMNGMGASGLGSGASGAGMATMSLSGLTAFGFKGNGAGLKGSFYDLKQTTSGSRTDAALGSDVTGGPEHDKGIQAQVAILDDFFRGGWDEGVLKKYFKADQSMIAPQIMMPNMPSEEATKAFGVDKQIKGLRWVVHYKAKVTAPRDGSFRFMGWGDDLMVVRFDKDTVLFAAFPQPFLTDLKRNFPGLKQESQHPERLIKGKWFQVERGKTYEMEVLVSEAYGGRSEFLLLVEERDGSYAKRTQVGRQAFPAYPVFQVLKGAKAPAYTPDRSEGNLGFIPETAPEPVIFQAK